MGEFLSEYGLFLAKTLTLVILIALLMRLSASSKSRMHATEKLEIKHLNSHYERMTHMLTMHIMPKKEFIKKLKAEKAHKKQKKHARRIFVLDFHGDIRATAVASLREEITAVLSVATPEDEVLLRLENGGGLVHEHGLAASQLERIRKKQIPLTIAVDKMAASGGYMMACVGNRIIAAPFAVIGSIGALMQLPNFHRLLDKHGIDFEQIKAGELKRTVTLFGINTDRDRELAKKQVEDIHQLFKEFITHYRPQVDLSQTATGQHWHAIQAQELNLIDDLETSDDYLLEASKTADLYEVSYAVKKTFAERFLSRVQAASDKALGLF
ncbi:Peptidase S49 domain protein [Nitrosococcus halophilus Nc 4]|uniref:Peptidase S49 domain protein n=1 Tax=Nitrosococcus halophilus (strain Nc4) TaxID=472759 RepID=D5BX62_NITHN|nr:protease SohB [Nitrosococcus halophilus]ADE15745.1 Peptidase S49 domain protein [Nitrosococcus halophilus Nc 4]